MRKKYQKLFRPLLVFNPLNSTQDRECQSSAHLGGMIPNKNNQILNDVIMHVTMTAQTMST
jgi:hypothetical protein